MVKIISTLALFEDIYILFRGLIISFIAGAQGILLDWENATLDGMSYQIKPEITKN